MRSHLTLWLINLVLPLAMLFYAWSYSGVWTSALWPMLSPPHPCHRIAKRRE